MDGQATPALHVKQFFLDRNELKLIVETTVQHSSILPDAPTRTSDSKGWLVCVDLLSSVPLQDRARVYGPLWDTPISHTGFDGIVFTKDDRQAAMATPFVAFDYGGNIVRTGPATSAGARRRSILTTTAASAIWEQQPPFSPPREKVPFLSEDSLQTPSHRYELRRGSDGGVALYDTLSGTPISKPWLTEAFSTYRGMKDMGNVTAWLTEDLEYLVCFPAWIWNRSLDGLPSVTEFEWTGHHYSRKEYAFIFHEPNPDPVIFRRPPVDGSNGLWGEPESVLVISEALYLQYKTKTNVVLWPFSRGPRYQLPTDELKGWQPLFRDWSQHREQDGKIAFFVDDFLTTRLPPSEHALVFLWDYRHANVARYEVHTREAFRKHLGQYRPRKAINPLEK